jgi:RNA recognition motif-containing protein
VCFSRVSCICRCLLAFVCCVSFRRRVVSRGEMTSTAGQPQFRYTQPPSKVLHVRNLPWECSEEELIELCKPFGKVVNTKVNVGANHNQAFVEFADLNQAISMVSYYASSSEPAQVRGKTVYLQYSNRQEIVTSKNSGDVASNVLLVTIEGVEAGHVSIDVLHLVSSTPLSDGSGVQNPNDYHHSCQGSGIIKGDLERWRCNK